MQESHFDEEELFTRIAQSGARVLLIGRRAMAALGLPVLTADYDFWLHIDDIETLNAAVEDLDLFPNRTAEQARKIGRYVLENDEHIDVLVARQVNTTTGTPVVFDDVWSNRLAVTYLENLMIALPQIQDLILTKQWASRDKDVADIHLLQSLLASREK